MKTAKQVTEQKKRLSVWQIKRLRKLKAAVKRTAAATCKQKKLREEATTIYCQSFKKKPIKAQKELG